MDMILAWCETGLPACCLSAPSPLAAAVAACAWRHRSEPTSCLACLHRTTVCDPARVTSHAASSWSKVDNFGDSCSFIGETTEGKSETSGQRHGLELPGRKTITDESSRIMRGMFMLYMHRLVGLALPTWRDAAGGRGALLCFVAKQRHSDLGWGISCTWVADSACACED